MTGILSSPEEQLQRILNSDESCLSMGGSKFSRGRRPRAVFCSPNLPLSGRPTGKSGLTTTFITANKLTSLPPWILVLLCLVVLMHALSSYIKINQLNARVVENNRKKLNA